MRNLSNIELIYLLRCGYDYQGDRKPWRSMWGRSGAQKEEQAWFNNTGKIARAVIEGKHLVTKRVEVLAEIPGPDFVNFEWLALTGYTKALNDHALQSINVGLILRTRNTVVQVLMDGNVRVDPRPEQDKLFHYATFGR